MKNIQSKIKEVELEIQGLKSERKYFTLRLKDCKNHECKMIDMMFRKDIAYKWKDKGMFFCLK